MLSKEQIKRASKKAVEGFHIPRGFSKETWEHNMLMCIKAKEEFVPNYIRNRMEISAAQAEAAKLIKGKKKCTS